MQKQYLLAYVADMKEETVFPPNDNVHTQCSMTMFNNNVHTYAQRLHENAEVRFNTLALCSCEQSLVSRA